MLDMGFIREHADEIQHVADRKSIDISVAELLEVDAERRTLLRAVETLRHERNESAANIGRLILEDRRDEAAVLRVTARERNERLAELEEQLDSLSARYRELMLRVPNVISADTPIGASDADNVELHRVGEPPAFDFPARDHVALAEALGLIDLRRGVKVAGSRGYFLKDTGVILHRAVQQLAVDLLVRRRFTILDTPLLVREEVLVNSGFFPGGRDQTYQLPQDDQWLIGTSEVPLVSYYANEIVDMEAPIRLAAVSNCFRREAGSAGRDVHGLYRVHQFAKVEQVVLCKNDQSISLQLFEEITQNARDLLDLLELPYRIVSVCTGDLSQKNYK